MFFIFIFCLSETESNRDLPNWFLRPNFNVEAMATAIKQKLQVPVSPTPEHLKTNKLASHVPVSPTRRNRVSQLHAAKKLRTDNEKNADFNDPPVVIQSELEELVVPLEETDSSNTDCLRTESPSYTSTKVKVTDTCTEGQYRTSKNSDSLHVEPHYTQTRLLPKPEPVDEEFDILENRSRTTTCTVSESVNNPELHLGSQDASVSPSNKITNTENVAKTMVQSDGTMFMMPQADKEVAETSGELFGYLSAYLLTPAKP